jgi:putative heme iron utilization protein
VNRARIVGRYPSRTMSCQSTADQCRAIARAAKTAALSTIAREPAGFPYVSLVAIAFDDAGRALMCLSRLAEHTQNLVARAEASLLVTEETDGDALAAGRVTILGRCAPVAATEASTSQAVFLAAHPEAARYASLSDFAMYRLDPIAARFIAGFGRMTWVDADEYARAWRA